MSKRIDKRECRRVQSRLISMTTAGTWFMAKCPEYADDVRDAVMCIKWLLDRDAKQEAAK